MVGGGRADPHDAANFASTLLAALRDAGLRERLVASGLQRARDLSWRTTAERTLAVYRRVLAAAGQARAEGGGAQAVDQFLRETLDRWRLMRPSVNVTERLSGPAPVPSSVLRILRLPSANAVTIIS